MNYRSSFFPTPHSISIANKIAINQIPIQKVPQCSQYRTHFKLMNVYRPRNMNDDQFVIKIAQKLKKYINCDIVQISEVIENDRVDLAIGMQSDRDAMIFLMKNQQIKLQAQRGVQETYEPRVSNVFKTYMNAKKHLFPQIEADMNRKELSRPVFSPPKQTTNSKSKQFTPSASHKSKSRSSSSSYSSSSRSSRGQNSQKKMNQGDWSRNKKSPHGRSRSRSKSYQRTSRHEDNSVGFSQSIKQPFMVQDIWMLCVPLECGEREVQARLKQRKIYPISASWRMIEDMEYLELRLERSIPSEILQNLQLKIGNYPCIVLPKMRMEGELRQEILKYQTQLISQQPINQETLLKIIIQVGGVISLVKDDYDDVERYIVTFFSVQRLKRFQHKVSEVFGGQILLSPPEEPIRLCRIEKMFSIDNIINEYAEKFKKSDYS